MQARECHNSKGKEKVVGLGKSGQDEITGLWELVEEMAEEMKEIKTLLKKVYEMGKMIWGKVIDLNNELELGYKSSEAETEEELEDELELELEVGEEEIKVLRREVNRWEAKQAEKQAAEVELEEELGSEYAGDSEEGEEDEEV